MLYYDDLNNEEKRILRTALNVERISTFYLEDNGILLMNAEELFEYIYLYDIKKLKDAINFINEILKMKINNNDLNKSIMQKILEQNNKIIKINNTIYAYKEG